MGIKGLHKALAFCTVKDNLRNYRNGIVAVDTSSWMHKSVYSISEKFVESTDRGCLDQACVRVSARYIIARCKELIETFGIRAVYLVMDGKRIPLKADETQDRDQRRQQNLGEARRFKRIGQKWKAEDKYKSCIRLRDDFTRAVIREVEKAFFSYGRVFFVNSPHEADSQLTRLVLDGVADAVITEDSDVLVYSAAAHKAFPVLFKLDRKTGDCDRINMEWLISPSPKETAQAVTSKNTLEFILRRFASKQTSTKGVGVRLFVQGCILSGCDYRKNIEGIGTTNAFKLVSENAFRGACVRFRKILESLPKKVRQKIDINEHEEILAKSEAIFFYHPVLHKDRQIKPLLTPRISSEDNDVETRHTDYYPYMSRFQTDWSFLGVINSPSNLIVPNSCDATNRNESRESTNRNESRESTTEMSMTEKKSTQSPSRLSPPTKVQILHNPYKKANSFDNKRSVPLDERNTNLQSNTGKEVIGRKKRGIGDITKFLVKPDPRYAKSTVSYTRSLKRDRKGTRVFSFSTASSSFRLSSGVTSCKKSHAQSFFEKRTTKRPSTNNTTSGTSAELCKFDYCSTDNNHESFSYPSLNDWSPDESKGKGTKDTKSDGSRDEFENLDRNLYEQDFYDLTNSNSTDIGDVEIETRREETKSKGAVAEDRTVMLQSNTVSESHRNDSEDFGNNSDPPSRIGFLDENERQQTTTMEQATSKYFTNSSNSRRVTLDPSSPSPSLGTSSVTCEKSTPLQPVDDDIISSPETRNNVVEGTEWGPDECIDDPDDELLLMNSKSPSQIHSCTKRMKSALQLPLGKTKSSLSRCKGSFGSFFARREKFASQLNERSTTQIKPRLPKTKQNDFFSPARYAQKKKLNVSTSHHLDRKSLDDTFFKKSIAQSQLNLKRNRSQSSEDYLWNGTP